MTKPALMIGLGEVLWDILPSGKLLGGAPANFAYMTSVLGDEGIVASRVGNDELGRDARRVMQRLGLNTSYLQQDNEHETGTATHRNLHMPLSLSCETRQRQPFEYVTLICDSRSTPKTYCGSRSSRRTSSSSTTRNCFEFRLCSI